MAVIAPTPKLQFFAANGTPLVGGKLYAYAAGTTTPLATYTDAGGGTPNANPVILDSRGEASVWLGAAQYKLKLTTSTDVEVWTVDNLNGADQVTIQAVLTQLAASGGSALVGFLQAGASAQSRTAQSKLREVVSVLDFAGADNTGVSDSYAAFAAAWAKIKSTGGTILIPPGTYLLNTQWTLDVDLTLPHQYKIEGYGAELKAGAAVTGHAIRVYRGYNNFGVTIEGLQFNHRNNTTVNGCIEGQGANNLRVINCAVEHHNTKAGYSGIKLGPYTPGDADTNTFWATIDSFHTRMRAGGEGTNADYGIRLTGQANAARITRCAFTSVNTAILFEEDTSAASGMANGVVIRDNAIEGPTTGVKMTMTPSTGTVPTGVLIEGNRVESCTTFVSITTGGAAAADAPTPPIICNNYLTNGSVTNELVNPNNQMVILDNPTYYGPSSAAARLQYNNGFQLRMRGTQSNLDLGNESGNSNYSGGHLVLGGYHLWVEVATGKLRIKGSAPTSDSDGTVVGTQT